MYSWVYKYRYWDADQHVQAVSRDLFTMEAIRAGLGTVIIESGIKVRDDLIDGNGRLKMGREPVERTG
jgi:hypothetical protein